MANLISNFAALGHPSRYRAERSAVAIASRALTLFLRDDRDHDRKWAQGAVTISAKCARYRREGADRQTDARVGARRPSPGSHGTAPPAQIRRVYSATTRS